jgi:hypothetical protein
VISDEGGEEDGTRNTEENPLPTLPSQESTAGEQLDPMDRAAAANLPDTNSSQKQQKPQQQQQPSQQQRQSQLKQQRQRAFPSEDHSQGGGNEQGEKNRLPGENIPLDFPQPKEKSAATHDENVGSLLAVGWRHEDILLALRATAAADGAENVQRAQEYLKQLSHTRIQRIAAEEAQIRAQESGTYEEQETVRAGGELALILAAYPGVICLALHLQEVHRKTRNAHNSELGRTAANLLAHEKVRNYEQAKQAKTYLLSQIALAVIHDCRECEKLRIKEAVAKKEAEERTRKAAEAKAREAQRKAAEAAEQRRAIEAAEARKAAERQKLPKTPPLSELEEEGPEQQPADGSPSDSFDERDSRWAKRKKPSHCWNCDQGALAPPNHLLYICDVCGHTIHKTCTKWNKVSKRSGIGVTKHACLACFRALPNSWKAVTPGNGSNMQVGTTANGTNVAHNRPQESRMPAAGQIDQHRSGAKARAPQSGDAMLSPVTTRMSLLPSPGTTPAVVGAGSSSLQSQTQEDQLSMKIRPYSLWEPLPADWCTLQEHSERGLGKQAYQNWKKRNLSLRDQARGKLGPLTNALTSEMLVSIGNALINEESLRPRPHMTDEELTQWIKDDPTYSWVKRVSDSDLIAFLDKHFSVLDTETFLAMRIPGPPKVPHTTSDNDVNYCATVHSAFAEQWLNRLTELRAGGWDDGTLDLRQAYINALENQPTLHHEAMTFRTTSHDRLISHMRAWTQQKTCEQQAHKQRRDKVRADMAAEVEALRTEVRALQQKQSPGKIGLDPNPRTPLPYLCQGCGRTYSRDGRTIPCEKACVYSEHAEHNSKYLDGHPWPKNKPALTWGTEELYLKKYGKPMPLMGKKYIEARDKQRRKREREREQKGGPSPKASKQP